jgi:uncharacterized protein (TIGR03086 family)
MDPLALHRDALAAAQQVVDRVDRTHFDISTPCAEWNVRQVLEHMIGGNRRVAGDPPGEGEDVIGADHRQSYAASAAASLDAFSAHGAMDRMFPLSTGEVPGSFAIQARSNDQLVHAWDLAKAIGVSTDFAPQLCAAALAFLQHRFATHGRNEKTYAEAQPAPTGSSMADRLAAFAGRRP